MKEENPEATHENEAQPLTERAGFADSSQEYEAFSSGDEAPNLYEIQAAEYQEEQAMLEVVEQNRCRRLFSVNDLIGKQWPKESFLIGPKLLPKRGRMLISGTTGTGKSVMALHLAASLATGQPMFGIVDKHKGANHGEPKFPVAEKSSVLYIDYEVPHGIRTNHRLRPMLEHYPADIQTNLFFAQHPTRFRLQNGKGDAPGNGSFDALKQLVEDVRPEVMIIDPLSSTHSLQENNNEIKQVFNNIDVLIDEFECAVIVVVHASPKVLRSKNGEKVKKDTIEEIRGHSSQGDWADCHIHLVAQDRQDGDAEDEKSIELSFGKVRHGRRPNKRVLKVNFQTMEVCP